MTSELQTVRRNYIQAILGHNRGAGDWLVSQMTAEEVATFDQASADERQLAIGQVLIRVGLDMAPTAGVSYTN